MSGAIWQSHQGERLFLRGGIFALDRCGALCVQFDNMPNQSNYAPGNSNLHSSKANKQDEFYTQLTDIEKELKHYRNHFRGKVIFCNCDDPEESNFWIYFRDNFSKLGLKKLISTHYEQDKQSYKLELNGPWFDVEHDSINFDNMVQTPLTEDGDFRSAECVELMNESDIVVTNPPFSLFREYMAQLVDSGKQFLVIGNLNAATSKEIFPLIKDGKVWLGYNSGHVWFRVPDSYEEKATDFKIEDGVKWRRMGNIGWYTNLDHDKRHEELICVKKYTPDEFPKYDEYDAINVNKTGDIPENYSGKMGVPITFLDKHNPAQFDLLGIDRYIEDNPHFGHRFKLNGKEVYARLIIKRK